MPAVGFICPNGDKVKFKDCLNGKCDHRCMCLPALKSTAGSHWYGRPSVTQLLAPTRSMYLTIKHDHYINPRGSIAAMIGTSMHTIMENNTPIGWISEVRLQDDITSGAFDSYDAVNHVLYDFKNYGAYKVACALGNKPKWVKKVITRGKNKGQERWEQVFEGGGVRHVHDVAWQLNYYRILMEKHGLPVDKMMVQIFVRGGVDKTAKSYGVTEPTYLLEINKISDRWVRLYFETKYKRLMSALEKDEIPPVCPKKDRWNDLRCKEYCSVHEFCPYWKENYGGKA